ncbi:major facilitator superfamily domain-containing protein 2B isoform X4 [Neophocaena asiaeorientalis asiaeorientalis]|uniref:Major facilitator superfamily domain-containing protein 2B isoform X4 n=1 Tax=Neophocaena asiaeorientalis asiaeorientalis TaxID=1706337 RepID=A0A341CZZ9_NEOAA|nr:major facilitator superfamily domain-containing protein 2B isoform X4 [Neophocaena asiaeorientalis asiaeorientalis]
MWPRSLLPRCHLSCLEGRCLGQLLTLWLGSSSTEAEGQGLDDSCPGCWAARRSLPWPPSSCGSCPPSPACVASGTQPSTPCSRPWQRPRERDSATVYRMTLEMAGTLMGATVHGLIVSGAHGSHRCKETALPGQVAVSPNATRLYSIAATVVAVTYPVCSSLLCLGVKERPGASARAAGQGLSFLAGLRLTVRHPPYLKLVISFLFISAAVQVEQSYLVLFCAHASRLHDHVQSLVLTILVSAVLSTPMWEWVLQRFGKRMAAFGIFGMVPFAILLAAMPTAPVAYVVAFVSGVSIAVSLLLPWSMLPDVVDEFQRQHQHGPGLETIFYSSYVFFTKLSGAGALGISTLSLDFAGYESGACKQAEQVVVTLKVLIGAMPTCMILIGLCILLVGPTPKVPSRNSSRSLGRRTSYSLA